MLQLSNVSLSTAEKQLICELSATIENGSFLTVAGKSGSGKSTLLSWIIGVKQSHVSATGAIHLNGRYITNQPPRLRNIGILFQDDLLFPHMTIEGNLLFAMSGKMNRMERKQKVAESLAEIQLEQMGKRYPHQLSGGERSRISLIRALVANPEAILLDEPFSKLDGDTRQIIRTLVFEKIHRFNIPAILVTHDPADYPPVNNTVISLNI